MSTKKSKDFDQKLQVRDKLRDFVEKKYAGQTGKQRLFAADIGATDADVSYWLKTGGAPAWLMLKIFEKFDDAAAFFLEGKPPQAIDLHHELHERIDELIKNKFIADHLEAALGFYEAFQQQHRADVSRAHMLRIMRQSGATEKGLAAANQFALRLLGHGQDPNFTVQDLQDAFGAPMPKKSGDDEEGTPTHPGKGSAPGNKK